MFLYLSVDRLILIMIITTSLQSSNVNMFIKQIMSHYCFFLTLARWVWKTIWRPMANVRDYFMPGLRLGE